MQVEVKYKDTDAAMDRETLGMLASGQLESVAGVKLRPITPGVVSLLDLIDSPLVSGGELTMLDMYRALYVIQHGADAVTPVLQAHREAEALERATEQAAASPDHYKVYLDALRASAAGWREFDAAACRYATSAGAVDFATLTAWMRDALHHGAAGFRMIEPDASATPPEMAQKKSTRLGLTGCLTWWARAVRFVRRFIRPA